MAISPEATEDNLQPEYDFRAMRGVVRGKYHFARCSPRPPGEGLGVRESGDVTYYVKHAVRSNRL